MLFVIYIKQQIMELLSILNSKEEVLFAHENWADIKIKEPMVTSSMNGTFFA